MGEGGLRRMYWQLAAMRAGSPEGDEIFTARGLHSGRLRVHGEDNAGRDHRRKRPGESQRRGGQGQHFRRLMTGRWLFNYEYHVAIL
eukprot:scaffold713_cov114-Isochrysis_galbana.AAC.3